jgi:hypothetical protein
LKPVATLGLVLIFITTAPASAAIRDVVLLAANPTYSGPCPIELSFSISMDGDEGTIFGWQLGGDAIKPTKMLYGYVPAQGSLSLNINIQVDVAHSGAHYAQAVVKYSSQPGSTDLVNTMESDKVSYIVTCVSPSPSP